MSDITGECVEEERIRERETEVRGMCASKSDDETSWHVFDVHCHHQLEAPRTT